MKTDLQWRSTIGISNEKFYEFLPEFGKSYGIELLDQALSRLGFLPKRSFKDVEGFKTYFESYRTSDTKTKRERKPKRELFR